MNCLRLLVLTAALVGLPATEAWAAEEVTVSDLIAMSDALAGVEVVVEGELVGDYGFRDDGWMWTQLNGDPYVRAPIREGGERVGGNTGIGVRMPTELGRGLDPPGTYVNRGPVVRLVGIWKHHDPQRQGESYLEVESLTVIEHGRPLHQGPQWVVMLVGAGLLAISALVWRRPRYPGAD